MSSEDVAGRLADPTAEPSPEDRRLWCLHAWQRHYGMQPRTDSHLTTEFVRGTLGWPVDVVARELMATDFLYKTTLYGETIEEFLRAVALRLRGLYDLSWSATWRIVRFYGPMALKLLMLLHTRSRIPARLA